MAKKRFIEVTLGDHSIIHGFNAENKEIREDILVEEPEKKLLALDNIISVDQEHIVMNYMYGRVIHWKYYDSYDELKSSIQKRSNRPY